eukprot:4484427-Amphidinium_carterae.1
MERSSRHQTSHGLHLLPASPHILEGPVHLLERLHPVFQLLNLAKDVNTQNHQECTLEMISSNSPDHTCCISGYMKARSASAQPPYSISRGLVALHSVHVWTSPSPQYPRGAPQRRPEMLARAICRWDLIDDHHAASDGWRDLQAPSDHSPDHQEDLVEAILL